MIARRILVIWLLFGLFIGAVTGLQIFATTERLESLIAFLAIGLAVGVVGGLGRVAFEWRRGGLGDELKSWSAADMIITGVVTLLIVGAGFARIASAPVPLYVALFLSAALIAVTYEVRTRRLRDRK